MKKKKKKKKIILRLLTMLIGFTLNSISMAGDLNHLSPHADFPYVILFFYS